MFYIKSSLLIADNTKPPLFADTFGKNDGDDSETSSPVTPAEEVVDNTSSTLSSLVENEIPRVLQLRERIGMGDVHVLMDNEGIHSFVQPNAREWMRLRAMVTGWLYQWVGGSPEEAMWEWMSDSQLAYSPYHLYDKVNFEGVENVTPWAADVKRRKRVKCYLQGNGRRKRKKGVGRDNGRRFVI
nr:hypothetical protein [Tanacetum cinerariifolium]